MILKLVFLTQFLYGILGYYIDFLGLKIILIVYSEYKNRIKNKPVKLMGSQAFYIELNFVTNIC